VEHHHFNDKDSRNGLLGVVEMGSHDFPIETLHFRSGLGSIFG
jgi:hypothetical protein